MSGSGVLAETGDQKITNLINTIDIIDGKLKLSVNLGIGAVGYAEVGGVVVDGALDGAVITDAMLLAYQNAVSEVMNHDYATATTAEQLFVQNHVAAMNNLSLAVGTLSDATSVLMAATSVAEVATTADTAPEQVALQEMLATDEFSIDATEVEAFNNALGEVEKYSQQAGAFIAAANNTSLTSSIDSYASQNNIVIGQYSAITYTQSVDEFVIVWDSTGNGTGWSGYLTDDMRNAEQVYGASQYILQNGMAVAGM